MNTTSSKRLLLGATLLFSPMTMAMDTGAQGPADSPRPARLVDTGAASSSSAATEYDHSVRAQQHPQGTIVPVILNSHSGHPRRAIYIGLDDATSSIFEKIADVYGIAPEDITIFEQHIRELQEGYHESWLKIEGMHITTREEAPISYDQALELDQSEKPTLGSLGIFQSMPKEQGWDLSYCVALDIDIPADVTDMGPITNGNYFISSRDSIDFDGFQKGYIPMEGSEHFTTFTMTAPEEYTMRMLLQCLNPAEFPNLRTIYMDSKSFREVVRQGLKTKNASFYESAVEGKEWSGVDFVLRHRDTGEVHYQFSR